MATANASENAKTSVSCSIFTTVQSSVHITLVLVFTSAILPLLALGNWGRLTPALCLPFKVVQMVYPSLHDRNYSRSCEGRGHTFQMWCPQGAQGKYFDHPDRFEFLYKSLQILLRIAQIAVNFDHAKDMVNTSFNLSPLVFPSKSQASICVFSRSLTGKELRKLGFHRVSRSTRL